MCKKGLCLNDFKFYETLYTILKSKEGSQAVKVDPREDVKDAYIDLRETKLARIPIRSRKRSRKKILVK